MNTWVARAHAKTRRELTKQTKNNEVNQSATTSKFLVCLVIILYYISEGIGWAK